MENNNVFLLKQANENYSILKKEASGIIRIIQDEYITKICLSFLSIKTAHSGSYVFVVLLDNFTRIFDIGLRPFEHTFSVENMPSIDMTICAGLFFVENDIPDLVVYHQSENSKYTVSDLKKWAIDYYYNKHRELIKEEKEKLDFIAEEKNASYDDEVVATQNYFELPKDDLPCDDENKDVTLGATDTISIKSEEFIKFKKDITGESDVFADNNEPKPEKEQEYSQQENKSTNYFDSVKEELDNIFKTFPEEENLKKVVPNSKWAKINYSDTKYYVVGICYENNIEKYICYGVPTINSYSPPKELAGFCSFVPLSIFNLAGKGYWIMFQDAKTGKCAKPSNE